MSDDSLALFNALLEGLRDVQATRFSRIASNSIILYDHLITLDKEVILIWQSKWSLPKILFLLNRYFVLAAALFNLYAFFSPALTDTLYSCTHPKFCVKTLNVHPQFRRGSCSRYFHWEGWTGLTAFMLAQAILQIRIYALYSLNKKILALMLTCYISLSAVSGWVMWTDLADFTATAVSIPGGKFCVPSQVFPHFYTFWIPVLVFDSLLCMLALIRGLHEFKSASSFFRRGRTLVEILIRDSVFYFLVIAITYLTCLLFWKFAPSGLLEAPIGFAPAMSCVLANRVLFNLREAGRDTSPLSVRTQNT